MRKKSTYGGLTTLMLQETYRMMILRLRETFGEKADMYLSYEVLYDTYRFILWPDGAGEGRTLVISNSEDIISINQCWRFLIDTCMAEKVKQEAQPKKYVEDFIC